jgi:hypothetical protein
MQLIILHAITDRVLGTGGNQRFPDYNYSPITLFETCETRTDPQPVHEVLSGLIYTWSNWKFFSECFFKSQFGCVKVREDSPITFRFASSLLFTLSENLVRWMTAFRVVMTSYSFKITEAEVRWRLFLRRFCSSAPLSYAVACIASPVYLLLCMPHAMRQSEANNQGHCNGDCQDDFDMDADAGLVDGKDTCAGTYKSHPSRDCARN